VTRISRTPAKRYLVRELEGEFVLLDLESGDWFTFEGTGNRAFQLYMEGRTEEEVAASLEAEHPETEPGRVRRDLDDFFSQIRRRRVFGP